MTLLKKIGKISVGNSSPVAGEFSENGMPFVRAGSLGFLVRGISIDNCERIDIETAKKYRLKLFAKGSVLFAKSGMSAKMGRIYMLPKNAYVASHIAVITVTDHRINNNFIAYYLSYNPPFNLIKDDSYPSISITDIENIEVPIPDLETQNKIVTILDKVKMISDKREKAMHKYDKLLQSAFLYMFDNPMRRPNKWSIRPIKDCLTGISAGKSYNGDNKKELEDDEIGVLKVSAVSRGFFNPSEYKAVKRNMITKSILQPYKNDLLFNRANTLELVGMTCIVDEDYDNLFLPDKIWKVETDETIIRKVYLNYVLQNKEMRKTFLSIATGSSGSMLNISTERFKGILIPYPPIELQKRFEENYLKYIELRKKLQLSVCFFKDLYNSLSQLLFKGEFKFGSGIDLEVLLENNFKFFKKNSDNKTIQLLLERIDKNELNENKFHDTDTYNKAKSFIFELIKEGTVQQVFDEQYKQVKLNFNEANYAKNRK